MRGGLSRIASLLVAVLWCGCRDGTSPNGILETATVTDARGDTFGSTGKLWDITALTVSRDMTSIIVRIDFTTPAFSPQTDALSGLTGYVDFDTDQNVETGGVPATDAFRPTPGTSVLGTDYQLVMDGYAADSTVAVVDASGSITGRVKPVFSGNSVTIRIPRAMLGGDDGFLNAAAIVGTGNVGGIIGRPTDFVPQSGHLTLDPKPPL